MKMPYVHLVSIPVFLSVFIVISFARLWCKISYSFPIYIILFLWACMFAAHKTKLYPLYTFNYKCMMLIWGHIINTIVCLSLYLIVRIIELPTPFDPYLWLLYLPAALDIDGFINAKIIRIKNYNLSNKVNKKICHLSDIHLGVIYKRNFVEKIVRNVKKINPDFVVITGDLFDGSMEITPDVLEPFKDLSMPIYYILGNHELMFDKQYILDTINKSNIQYIGGQTITIDGVNLYGYDFHFGEQVVPNMSMNDKGLNILLKHVPDVSIDELSRHNVDIMLSGHTHGGQMFPLQIPTYLQNKYFGGLYRKGNICVYVSTGVGTALIPMRTSSHSVIGVLNI